MHLVEEEVLVPAVGRTNKLEKQAALKVYMIQIYSLITSSRKEEEVYSL